MYALVREQLARVGPQLGLLAPVFDFDSGLSGAAGHEIDERRPAGRQFTPPETSR